jgi:hypothetical protein
MDFRETWYDLHLIKDRQTWKILSTGYILTSTAISTNLLTDRFRNWEIQSQRHNEHELSQNLLSTSVNKYADLYKEMINAYKFTVRKPERKRLLRRHRHRWDNTEMHVGVIHWEDIHCIHLAQNRYQ